MQTAATRIGHDLKIFEILANSGPKTLEELQSITNAHPVTLGMSIITQIEPKPCLLPVLGRLLRYMASVGLIREAGVNLFEANKKSRNLATAEAVTIVTHL